MVDPLNVLKFVENDGGPDMTVEYTDIDITDYTSLVLKINYKPHPLEKNAVVTSAADGQFKFTFNVNAESTVLEAVEADDTTIKVQTADYADFPSSGMLQIGDDETRETVRYASKTAPNILNLTDALEFDHAADEDIQALGDLRKGRHNASVTVTNADEVPLTFTFIMDIEAAIR
jgi:hypothetical protein